jgi:hypothetical protein
MARASKDCIFCGRHPTTREHIWADWLRNYISKDMQNHVASRAIIRADQSIETNQKLIGGDPRSRQLQIVCEPCNNRWMSKLQNDAKSTLIPLIQGKTFALSGARQRITAAWSAMSVICAEYLQPDRAAISVVDRRWLFMHLRPSERFRIWIGDYERDHWPPHWAHSTLRITEFSAQQEATQAWAVHPDGTPRPNTQTTVFVVGRLYILAFTCPFSELLHSRTITNLMTDKLVQIWPPRHGYIGWPPRFTLKDKDADDLAGAILRKLDQARGVPVLENLPSGAPA